MIEIDATSGTIMNDDKSLGARPNRNWLHKPEIAEPIFYVGTIGLICLYLWLMISYWIG